MSAPVNFPMTEESIRTLIDRQGWSWSLGRHRGAGDYEACIHPKRGVCILVEAATPKEALVEAFAQAMRAEPASGLVSTSMQKEG